MNNINFLPTFISVLLFYLKNLTCTWSILSKGNMAASFSPHWSLTFVSVFLLVGFWDVDLFLECVLVLVKDVVSNATDPVLEAEEQINHWIITDYEESIWHSNVSSFEHLTNWIINYYLILMASIHNCCFENICTSVMTYNKFQMYDLHGFLSVSLGWR